MVTKEYICQPGKNSKVVIEDFSVEIRDNPTFIIGFAGMGLLGPIITNTLIEQISDIQEIGFITSEYLPPISVFYEGELKHPFRLYYSQMYNIIIGTCEIPFDIYSAYNDLAKTICNWALSEDVNAKEIVVFQGIYQPTPIDDYPVYFAADEEMVEFLEKYNLNKVEKGIITGPEATLLNEALTNRLKTYALFTPVQEIPTPEGAASIIEVLNKIYGLNIETKTLIEEGKKIKTKMLELAQKAQQIHNQQNSPQIKNQPYTTYFQ
ncbi:MAG: proteasome assembly chaperone family protein [Promethearchaeota archaeon]